MTETGSSQERKALKRRIRREVLAVRDALSEEALRRASCLITERLLGHQWFYRAESLLCYVSYGSELDTHELLREALRLGKRVYVPRVLEDHGMDFFRSAPWRNCVRDFTESWNRPGRTPGYTGMEAEQEFRLWETGRNPGRRCCF